MLTSPLISASPPIIFLHCFPAGLHWHCYPCYHPAMLWELNSRPQNLWFGPCRSLRSGRWQRTQHPSHFSRTRTQPCTHRPHSATSLLPGEIPAAIHPSKPEGNSSRFARISINQYKSLLSGLAPSGAFCHFSVQIFQAIGTRWFLRSLPTQSSLWSLNLGFTLWTLGSTHHWLFQFVAKERENTSSCCFTGGLSCLLQAVSNDTHSEFRGCRILILTM